MERKSVNNAFYDDLKDQWYDADDHPIALLRAENAARTPWIIEKIQEKYGRPCSILDIGCGAGFLTNALAVEGHQVVGIDASKKSLEVAEQRDLTASVTYKQADAYQLPFADQSFDIVSALDFLEHVEKPDKVIAEASRVLKPGGAFFFYTFNRSVLSYLVVLKGVEWFVKNTPPHMHLFRLFLKPSELKRFCERQGLFVEGMQGVVPDIQKKAFWKMLVTRRVSSDFSFRLTSSLACGYLGVAKKA